MEKVIYGLCAITSAACAVLLLRSFLRNRLRLLLWSGLCFVGLTANNLLVMVDRILLPDVDLATWRLGVALGAVLLLLYGLIVESRS